MTTTINLTTLAETRERMTPGDLVHHQTRHGGEIVFDAVFAADGDSIASDEHGNDADFDPDNAAGIVATHNAADVLIEVARIAKLYADTRDVAAHQMLLAALAKVSL